LIDSNFIPIFVVYCGIFEIEKIERYRNALQL